MKLFKEWFFKAPWGKIALMSWGPPSGRPLLLLHGFMDGAATFLPLVQHLPDRYLCVGLEFPGHGLSDPLPTSTLPINIHLVAAVRVAVTVMKWREFALLTHSMGALVGAYYNAVYPNEITKVINIDPEPIFYFQNMAEITPLYYKYLYDDYYRNYSKYTNENTKTYTHEEAINNIAEGRKLTKEQAEIVLTRSLIPVGNGRYRLSYDQKMKKIALLPISRAMLLSIMTRNTPPTLHIHATEHISLEPGKSWAENIIKDIQATAKNHISVFIEGGHDIHITRPKDLAEHIERFLDREFPVEIKAKI